MMKKVLIGLVVAVLLLSFSLPSFAEEPIKIGLITPLTGAVSTFGQSVRNSAVLAVDTINERGGIHGRMIDLIVLDDQGDATEAANATRRLIDRDEVVLIIGPVITPCVLAAAPIAQDAGIPLITPTGTGDTITEIGDMIFRAAYKDSFQGQMMARFAREVLELEQAAIIYDVANDYSTGLMNSFRDTFIELGGEIVRVESYTTNDSDFSAQLTSIAMRQPDALFVPDYYTAAGPIAMQSRQLGIDATLLGVDGWDSPAIHELAGGYEVGAYIVNHYSPDDETPSTQEFISVFSARYPDAPDALAALAYDAVQIVEAALNATGGSTDPQELKTALGTVSNIQAATGTINMDPEGTPVKAVVILQMTADGSILVDKVEP